jgi:hypothetical protein
MVIVLDRTGQRPSLLRPILPVIPPKSTVRAHYRVAGPCVLCGRGGARFRVKREALNWMGRNRLGPWPVLGTAVTQHGKAHKACIYDFRSRNVPGAKRRDGATCACPRLPSGQPRRVLGTCRVHSLRAAAGA